MHSFVASPSFAFSTVGFVEVKCDRKLELQSSPKVAQIEATAVSHKVILRNSPKVTNIFGLHLKSIFGSKNFQKSPNLVTLSRSLPILPNYDFLAFRNSRLLQLLITLIAFVCVAAARFFRRFFHQITRHAKK